MLAPIQESCHCTHAVWWSICSMQWWTYKDKMLFPIGAQRAACWLYILSTWATASLATNNTTGTGIDALLRAMVMAINVSCFWFKQQRWLGLQISFSSFWNSSFYDVFLAAGKFKIIIKYSLLANPGAVPGIMSIICDMEIITLTPKTCRYILVM